jgi:cytochrome c-type biogenesis protein CcmH/NrfG
MTTRRKVIANIFGLSAAGMTLLVAGCATVSVADEANTLLQEGQALYNAKRYDEAIAKFREAVAKDPNNWSAYLWMARAFIAKGTWADAITAARRAFELSPQGPEVAATFFQALFGGGMEALNGGRFVDSIKYLGEYVRHQPGNASAWLAVGKAYMGNRQFMDGLNAAMKALGSGGDRGEILKTIFGGGAQAFGQRDYASAIELMREYVRQDPRNLQAYLTLAKSYWESGQRSGALEAFREVIKIAPTNGEALNYLRQLL